MTDVLDPRSGGPGGAADSSGVPVADWDGAVPTDVPDAPQGVEEEPTSRLTGIIALIAIIGLFGLATVAWGPWALFFIAALLLSVTLHEFGHYLAARQAGMKVTEFFIGFGPRLLSFRKGETTYGVKPVPAGAYVKIIGMNNLEDVEPGDEGRTYREKGYWARLRVVLAGPAMNLTIALVLLFVCNLAFATASKDHWKVDQALPGTAAAAVGVQSGDRVVSLAGQPVSDFDAFGQVIQDNAGKTVDLVVERDGQQVTLTPTLGWALTASGASALAPLQEGDVPSAVAGAPVSDYDSFVAALAAAQSSSVPVRFERSGSLYDTTVTPPATMPDEGDRGFLGVKSSPDRYRQGPLQAAHSAVDMFGGTVSASVSNIGKFFSPSGLTNYTKLVFSTPPSSDAPAADSSSSVAPIVPVDPGAPAAPTATSSSPDDANRIVSILGVIRLGSQAGEAGLASAILLLAIVNLFLGLINLVPLLPFDGGHAAIATYEEIRGRLSHRQYRVDIAKLMPVAYAVLMVFVFIGVTSIYLDAVKPLANPYGP